MNKNRIGKLSPDKMENLIGNSFGKCSNDVIVGPGAGLDAAVLKLSDGRVMAIAEDPIFPAPGLPLETFGWFTVHIGASDVAVTGIKPQFMTYTLLLPPSFSEEDTKTIIKSISKTAEELGITIVGGHTGWYGAVTVPTVGGVSVWGFADSDKWISPGGARDGDSILMTKGPSIEASALLAILKQAKLKGRISDENIKNLIGRSNEITVVKDALLAFETGEVNAMHDATEGGVIGGLWEMYRSSGIPVFADFDRVDIPDDIYSISKELNFNPWEAISEGTLLAAVKPGKEKKVMELLKANGIESWILGRFDSSIKKNTVRQRKLDTELICPEEDPFWKLFFGE
ncbi:MAG TPA: AIR synthase family protein [Spirochaetota bacterium]|nr:AIR synthase family protein [Spirochaetota bacterium]HOR44543.1 AIR synthase family protein [Spirochaetota bacterium]